MASLRIRLHMALAVLPSSRYLCTKSIASCGPKTPQNPSHPMSTKASCGFRSKVRRSGTALMPTRLKARSPKERDTSTRPCSRPSVTTPPAFSMRERSGPKMALCSFDRVMARREGGAVPPPVGGSCFRASTALASPTLARCTTFPTTHMHTAVAPSCQLAAVLASSRAVSVRLKPSRMAFFDVPTPATPASSTEESIPAANTLAWRCCAAKSAARLPP
mmetsp:Transcript_8910/g.18475  ORF Transcript_8910/g.18475 Transcript_8910/m.18475 type:complete len:219 (-) Transcript_8910:543-1199(-)